MKIKIITPALLFLIGLFACAPLIAQDPAYIMASGGSCYSGTPVVVNFSQAGPCSGTVATNGWSVTPSTGVTISPGTNQASISFTAAGRYTISADVICSNGSHYTATYKFWDSSCGCYQTYYEISAAPTFSNMAVTFGNFEYVTLTAPENATNPIWKDLSDNVLATGPVFNIGYLYDAGTYKYKVQLTGSNGCSNTAFYDVVVSDQHDERINSVESKGFDVDGSIANHTKQYFNGSGIPIQSQSKTLTNNLVFISQPVTDKYLRTVGTTLAAPGRYNYFNYQADFVWGVNKPYDENDFDTPLTLLNPNPVGVKAGTLGYYYSDAGNTQYNHNLKTSFPYSRTDFYNDEFNGARRMASAGDQHRMGSGHEVLTGSFPVYDELNDYIDRRDNVIPGVNILSTLEGAAFQTVTKDQNGTTGVSISDKNGHVVMTARAGTLTDKVLSVTNVAEVIMTSASPKPMIYFYIFEDQNVTITGSSIYTIENLVTGYSNMRTITTGATNTETLVAGFYRLTLTSGTNLIATYTNHYADVSYQYYDNSGKIRYSLSPNGYQQLTQSGANYSTADHTEYTYNFAGFLLTIKEPDAGITNYYYRNDGSILYSQNAEQATAAKGYFSYTNYDYLNRPIESGEYHPPSGASANFANLNKTIQLSAQSTYTTANKYDWIKTYYDIPDATAIPYIPGATYKQQFVTGAVSYTENVNMKTWYSYDELGRVTWIARNTKYLPMTFLTEYTYDFLGHIVSTKTHYYDANGSLEGFYHHYEYDDDNRLARTLTSTDGTTKTLRATYEYYLHGPLKRIELGDDVQGIDLVYNINGWLTQINHPDKSQDPGQDGDDAFGMLIDYYESSISNLFSASTGAVNPNLFHGLPEIETQDLKTEFAHATHDSQNLMELQRSVMTLRDSYHRSGRNLLTNKIEN